MRVTEAEEIVEDEVKIVVTKKVPTKDTEELSKNNTAGRKMIGKSKADNLIQFRVDDEQLEYLKSLMETGRGSKLKTENAVAKKIFINDYDMHKKSNK